MSTPSQPLCIGMINLCIEINSNISLNTPNSHSDSWIILWHNQHNIFIYPLNQQHTIDSLPGPLSNTFILSLWEPQTFIHCGCGGEWIENYQSNPAQTLFVEGILITDQNEPSSSQKHNLALMFFILYPKILFVIESFRKQDLKLKMPKEYDCNSHRRCQIFTPTTPTPPSYPAIFSLSSKQKLIQLPSGSDLPMINTPLLAHQKSRLAFLWDF
ncbi:hypothetical protein O181_065771 [Austropuccinia psidii MF-1]|uniref:Uncharacterized protein n=1 Tax=Austropuccinia psidii MF-1 TaxID=1389203 RepID=A0A9Q3EW94_9BASI|nr:hypothetical protein [Austropuccinia psidii MF-1]